MISVQEPIDKIIPTIIVVLLKNIDSTSGPAAKMLKTTNLCGCLSPFAMCGYACLVDNIVDDSVFFELSLAELRNCIGLIRRECDSLEEVPLACSAQTAVWR